MITQYDNIFIKENSLIYSINDFFNYFENKYSKKEIKNFCDNNKITYKKENKETRSILRKSVTKKQRQQTLINHNYFKTWSNNMAYIFGLWCADGNIYINKGYFFSISLHRDDKYLLEYILQELESEHKIYESKNNSIIKIGSKTIVDDIINLGGVENKSLILKFPNIPDEFLKDFIRGYFDGNGWITYSKSSNSNVVCICSGSKDFADELLKKIRCNCKDVSGSISKRGNVYTIHFGKKDSKILSEYIYNSSSILKLKRKYDKLNISLKVE